MKYLRWAFWGSVTGVDMLGAALFITMYFHQYSVLYMLMDATYSVWYFAAGGAILGISFGASKSKPRYLAQISKKNPRGISAGRCFISEFSTASPTRQGIERVKN